MSNLFDGTNSSNTTILVGAYLTTLFGFGFLSNDVHGHNNCHMIFSWNDLSYHNPNLGFVTKARGCKVACQKGDLGVTSHVPRSAKNAREWNLTLPSELQCWELESQKDSQIFRAWLQGSKPIYLRSSLYHWKLIEV